MKLHGLIPSLLISKTGKKEKCLMWLCWGYDSAKNSSINKKSEYLSHIEIDKQLSVLSEGDESFVEYVKDVSEISNECFDINQINSISD